MKARRQEEETYDSWAVIRLDVCGWTWQMSE
jgi:hypothetical protein